MAGDFAYEAVIRMHQAAARESGSELEIRSDLQGVTMDLPPPYGKQAESVAPLDLHIQFGKAVSSLPAVWATHCVLP